MNEEKHSDHEPEMIRSQLKTAERASKSIKKHTRKKDNFKAWVQSKITKASDYLDTAADYLDSKEKEVNEGSLRKWFKGSKSKDGKGGWVNVVTGGTCASDEPGEGTPKCVSRSKYDSMSKKERESAARRKKAADPNQQSKTGAAKPTYVATDKKKKMKESKDLVTVSKELDKASKMHKNQANRVRKHIKDMHKEEKQPKNCGCGKDPCITYGKKGMKEGNLQELSGRTLGNYVRKASLDAGKRLHAAGMDKGSTEMVSPEKLNSPGYSDHYNKKVTKATKRLSGVGLATKKMQDKMTPDAYEGKTKKESMYSDWKNEELVLEVKDKKGKGSGTKDACYTKVKSRYSVWPSAYASGALVRCRKVGAANWGNKSESVEMKNYLDKKAKKLKKEYDAQSDAAKNNPHFDSTQPSPSGRNKYEEVEYIDEISKKTLGSYVKKASTQIGTSAIKGDYMKMQKRHKGVLNAADKLTKESFQQFQEKCWKGYEKKGMKTMFGKRYPNCVKKTKSEEVEVDTSSNIKEGMGNISHTKIKKDGKTIIKVNKNDEADAQAAMKNDPKYILGKTRVQADEDYSANPAQQAAIAIAKREKKEGDMVAKAEKKQKIKIMSSYDWRSQLESELGRVDECWKTHKKVGMKMKGGKLVPNCVPKNEEFIPELASPLPPPDKDPRKKPDKNQKPQSPYLPGKSPFKEAYGGKGVSRKAKLASIHPPTAKAAIKNIPDDQSDRGSGNKAKKRMEKMIEAKSPAWQRKAGKSESGGLNAKGVASYRAANPGSKLKTAVTTEPSKLKKGSKSANRRKSFCARMKGMKKRLTSAKTARDPDSRINKSLRKWNC